MKLNKASPDVDELSPRHFMEISVYIGMKHLFVTRARAMVNMLQWGTFALVPGVPGPETAQPLVYDLVAIMIAGFCAVELHPSLRLVPAALAHIGLIASKAWRCKARPASMLHYLGWTGPA